MDLAAVQGYMRDQRIDGWLLYDFRGNNPVLAQLLPGKRWTTRRALYLIPGSGRPVVLNHGIDENQFKMLSVDRERYLSWGDFNEWLRTKLSGMGRVAMEYAAGGALPVVSIVDSGTVEHVRSLGVEVVSSANLIQVCAAVWSPEAQKNHAKACAEVTRIKDGAFGLIRERLAAGKKVLEHEVQAYILDQFKTAGLETTEPPIVGVNPHSGDPHYFPSADHPMEIKKGDWILIDLWARVPGDENVYCDITWVGFAGKDVPGKHREVFEVVRKARDSVVERAVAAWKTKERVCGWQLDDAAREVIVGAGYGEFIRHRTGHSLSPGPEVHGMGVNIDNLETHDTREMLPGIGFTVEPGVYLPEFGVRLEIDVFVDPSAGPTITSCKQDEIVLVA